MHGNVVSSDVIQLRSGPLFRLPDRDLVFCYSLRDFGRRVVKVPRQYGVFRTNNNTRRLQSQVHFMGAVMAFCRRPGIWIDINGIIWTRLHACLAANTHIRIKFYYAVIPLIHRGYRANPDAWWIGTVITPGHLKITRHVGIQSRLHALYPCTLNAEWNLIFAFARRRTRVASNTGIIIDYKAVIHKRSTSKISNKKI